MEIAILDVFLQKIGLCRKTQLHLSLSKPQIATLIRKNEKELRLYIDYQTDEKIYLIRSFGFSRRKEVVIVIAHKEIHKNESLLEVCVRTDYFSSFIMPAFLLCIGFLITPISLGMTIIGLGGLIGYLLSLYNVKTTFSAIISLFPQISANEQSRTRFSS